MAEFTIPQKKKEAGEYRVIGEQVVSIDNKSENVIGIGANLTNGNGNLFSIVHDNGKTQLKINKNCEQYANLKELENFATASDDNSIVLDVKNVEMYSNEDISFKLSGKSKDNNNKYFDKLSIASNSVSLIVREGKEKKESQLLYLGNEFMSINLPKNIVQLTKNNSPISLKKTEKTKSFSLPAQMFPALQELAKNGEKDLSCKEFKNIGKDKKQTLRIVRWGNKVLVGDGTELKEVEAGIQIVPAKNKNGTPSNKKYLIVKFNKATQKIGQGKNTRLIEGLTQEDIENISKYFPEKTQDGTPFIVEDNTVDLEKTQIEQISALGKPKSKSQFAKGQDVSFQPTAANAALESANAEPVVETILPKELNNIIPTPEKNEIKQRKGQKLYIGGRNGAPQPALDPIILDPFEIQIESANTPNPKTQEPIVAEPMFIETNAEQFNIPKEAPSADYAPKVIHLNGRVENPEQVVEQSVVEPEEALEADKRFTPANEKLNNPIDELFIPGEVIEETSEQPSETQEQIQPKEGALLLSGKQEEQEKPNEAANNPEDKTKETLVVKEEVKQYIPFPHLLNYIFKGFLLLTAVALTVLSILGGLALWVPIVAGAITFATATSFGVDLKKDLTEYAKKKASTPTKTKIKKIIEQENTENKTKNKKKKNTKQKGSQAEKPKQGEQQPKKPKQPKQAPKQEPKKEEPKVLTVEEMNANINTLRNNTTKIITKLEEYNNIWGKHSESEEKLKLLEDSKKCVEELKDFQNSLPTEVSSVENYAEILRTKQELNTTHGKTINAIKKFFSMDRSQSL